MEWGSSAKKFVFRVPGRGPISRWGLGTRKRWGRAILYLFLVPRPRRLRDHDTRVIARMDTPKYGETLLDT